MACYFHDRICIMRMCVSTSYNFVSIYQEKETNFDSLLWLDDNDALPVTWYRPPWIAAVHLQDFASQPFYYHDKHNLIT